MRVSTTLLRAFALVAFAPLQQTVIAHTWAEAINVISPQGTLLEPDGYGRNYHPRGSAGFTGTETSEFNKIEPGAGNTLENAHVCAPFQAQQVQTPDYPRLRASPGDMIAVRYAENGHVTLLEEGRPEWGGLTWIYGTTHGTENPMLSDVMDSWTTDGTGGGGMGRLLAEQYFDDGRCYEKNSNEDSLLRQEAAPIPPEVVPLPNYGGLHCQSNFRLPEDVPVGQPYTVYWVWNFSKPDVQELYSYYSVCLDIDIVEPNNSSLDRISGKAMARYDGDQAPYSAAVQQYFSQMVAGDSIPTGGPAPPVPPGAQPSGTQPPPDAQGVGQPVGANPAEPLVYQTSTTPQPSAIASHTAPANPRPTPPTQLPSVSVPLSLISAGTVDPYVGAQPTAIAPDLNAPGAAPPATVTVTQSVTLSASVTPEVSTLMVTVTAAPPALALGASLGASPSSSATDIQSPGIPGSPSQAEPTSTAGPQGTGSLRAAAAATTPRTGITRRGGYKRLVPPVPQELDLDRPSARFRIF